MTLEGHCTPVGGDYSHYWFLTSYEAAEGAGGEATKVSSHLSGKCGLPLDLPFLVLP